jgi:hypothetical protein
MPKRNAVYEFDQNFMAWTVRRYVDGKVVHESRVESKEIAEAAVREWNEGGGPELIVE